MSGGGTGRIMFSLRFYFFGLCWEWVLKASNLRGGFLQLWLRTLDPRHRTTGYMISLVLVTMKKGKGLLEGEDWEDWLGTHVNAQVNLLVHKFTSSRGRTQARTQEDLRMLWVMKKSNLRYPKFGKIVIKKRKRKTSHMWKDLFINTKLWGSHVQIKVFGASFCKSLKKKKMKNEK